MCCSTYMNETVAWGVSGMKLQSWIPGVSFMLNCEAFLVGPSIHPPRCQTPTPIGQSLTLTQCRMASASRTAAIFFRLKCHVCVQARPGQHVEPATVATEVSLN